MTQIFDGIEFKGITSKSLSLIGKDLGRRQRAEELTYRYEVLDSSTDYIEHTDNFKPYTRKMEFHIIDPNRKDEIFDWLKGYGILKTIKEIKPTVNLLPYGELINNYNGWISWAGFSTLNIVEGALAVKNNAAQVGQAIGVVSPEFEVDLNKSYSLSFMVGSHYSINQLDYCHLLFSDGQGNQKLNNVLVNDTNTNLEYRSLSFKPIRSGKVKILLATRSLTIDKTEGFRINKVMVNEGTNTLPFEKSTNETNGYFKASVISALEVEDNIGLEKFKVDFLINPPFMFLDSGLTPVTVTSGAKINNPGTYKSEPIIHIVGSGNINLTVNRKTSTITGLVSEIFINAELQHCYNGTADLDGLYKGDYPELTPGENTINWSGGTVTKVEVIPNWRNL